MKDAKIIKRGLSLLLAWILILSSFSGVPVSAVATEAVSGTDENGFTYTSDGTSVTVTGHTHNANGALFYGIAFEGHYYGLSTDSLSWTEAEAACEASGGYLVSINSAEEQAAVEELLLFAPSGNQWIGGYQTDDQWQWTDGAAFTYTNWYTSESTVNPGDGAVEWDDSDIPFSLERSAGTTGTPTDYAYIYHDGYSYDLTWDKGFTGNCYYICEWDEEPGDDIWSRCSNELCLPSEINGLPVTAVADSAFQGNQYAKLIAIPEGIVTVGAYAFEGCVNLATVSLGETVTAIGKYAFANCTGLKNVYFAGTNSIKVDSTNAQLLDATIHFGHVHSYGEWTVDREPTCVENGKQHRTCTVCGCIEQGTIGTVDHTYGSTVVLPTCLEQGYTLHTCSVCQHTYKDSYVKASGHSYGEWITDSASTCVESGKKHRICAACGDVEYETIGTVDHAYETKIVPPTCLEQGYTLHTCSVCQHTYKDSYVKASGHAYGEWVTDSEPTCVETGKKHRTCIGCGNVEHGTIETVDHTYETEVVPPTYLKQGYTLYTCSVCGDTYKDTYVDPLERVDLSEATLELEYTSAYYEGVALRPGVTLTYQGETFDSTKELKITYTDNDRVGIATATVEGINRFKGTAELSFTISYKDIPEQITNVVAIGEIGKISLSWGQASEVNTDCYHIYRKADGETEYQLIKEISGRTVLSFEDKSVEKGKTYSYYVTGIGLYGAEGEPSLTVTATVLTDEVAPTILKVSPVAASVISGKETLSATATDNVGVVKVAYFYTLDNGETWVSIGETTNKAFSIVFDTSDLNSESVKVKAVAYDAEGNESAPVTVVYSLDNVGPEKVTGLSATTLSSKITLSWNDVTANDAAYFILQVKRNNEWTTVAGKITTLGYTLTGLQPDTEYIYRVACVDTHGNIGEYSDAFTTKTAVDETAPVITSQSPSSSRYNSTIRFSATAKDDCDVASIAIQVSTDLSSWTTISTKTYSARTYTQTYTYTIDLSAYAEGSIFVRAVATDHSGNISDTSDAAPYTEYIVDKTAPEAPTGVTATGNDGYITVSWDIGNEADLSKYFVYRSTSLDGEYQVIASNLSTRNYHDRDVQTGKQFYYKVKVSDTCGNMSAYSGAVWATMSPDTQKPEITSISSTYQQRISSAVHTINVAATDNNKLSCIVVEYCTSTDPVYKQLAAKENIDSYYKSISVTLPIDELADGDTIYIRAYAVDAAGLRSEQATAKYTLDTTPPAVENFTALLDASTVYINWKDCGESDLSGFKVYRSTDGEAFTLLGSRNANSTGAYAFIDTITAKESNTYTYKLEAIDKLGNTAWWLQSVDYTYVYVNQAPVAQMLTPDLMTVGVEEIFDASGSTDDIAITDYLWDFGDGTTSTEIKPVKSYALAGTYTVMLTVTDNEGVTSVATKNVEVKERDMLGTLHVKVVDENGKALPYVPVYFDLGSDSQKIVYTDATGIATLQMLSGTHTIGMYASAYLPVKKDVVVLANATRTVTLTTVEENIVTGNFEVTRMEFEEIKAAGIDVYDPANQNVYSATVRVTYGSSKPLTIQYYRNDDSILSYSIKDSNGNNVTHYTNSNGESRKITGITYIPSSHGNSEVVAIMDVPAEASYLKDFFNVRLHIVNNASSDFVLEKNEIVLHVPEGMTLMTSVSEDYATSDTVILDSIEGQETATIAWVLRGDKAGEYTLFADFTGTLAEFNETVSARFETEDPIKVYGLDGVKFRILAADEIHNDTLYFNVELENERDIDIDMPTIGLTDKVANVTESVLNQNADGDFSTEACILNAYIQTENGQKQYLLVTYDANGRATTAINKLAPGQKIVYEYVAYNAIHYDGVAYFKEAAITEFEGIIDNIEVGSFHKELYSFTDHSEKLDEILSGSDADVKAAFDHISTDGNYYYWAEAEDEENGVLKGLYAACDVLFNGDLTHFTQEEKKELIKTTLLSILSDSSIVEQTDELIMEKYNKAVSEMIGVVELGTIEKYTSEELSKEDIAKVFKDIAKDSKTLAITYQTKGSEAFKAELSEMVAKSSVGLMIDASVMLEYGDEAEIFAAGFGTAQKIVAPFLNAVEEMERDACYYSVLKLQCNAQISEHILDSVIAASQNGSEYSGLIKAVAEDLKKQLNTSMEEYYNDMHYAATILEEAGKAVGKAVINALMKKMIGSTPLAVLSAGFNILDSVFGFGDYYKQQDSMCVYDALTVSFANSFNTSVQTRNSDNDFYSMLLLRAMCELRLSGEKQYKSFVQNYIDGVYGIPLSEESVMKKVNGVFKTEYTTMDEWYDEVQYNIVRSRDILFNIENASELETPRAPVVTLDYDILKTLQSFTAEYEYCFADGVWRACSDEPISFTVGETPSVLRVRKAASDTNLAGEITTVKIFARRDLSKLITAKFDGVNYLLDNLSNQYCYQIVFTNDAEETVDWSAAQTIIGSKSTVKISGVEECNCIWIRSCQSTELSETTSNPLCLTVSKKRPLNLVIDGNGKVAQTADSGCYFNGDSVDLIATANAQSSFEGWYIDDVCVSTDNHYIVEMADDLEVVARFTGAKIKNISIEQLPTKLSYREGESLDLNGMKVLVTYSDGTTDHAEQFAAQLSSNTVGKSTVVITYGGYSASYDVMISHDGSLPLLSFKGASLSLHSNLAVNFKADKALFEADGYTGPYVVFELNGVKTTVRNYTVDGDRYVFSFRNIAPDQMNDTICATLYATYDGVEYASETKQYSVAEYCYGMLSNYATDEYAKLRTLLVDLLHYGAQSQLYTQYKTDDLVDSRLTETQLTWGTADDPVLTNSLNTAYETVDAPLAVWKGAGLTLKDSITMRFKLTAESIDGLCVKIHTETDEWVITADRFVKSGNAYYVYFGALNASQMSEKVYLTVYKGDVAVSNTVCYSIESYAYEKQNSSTEYVADLVKAMMKYGNSAHNYVNG